MPHRLYKKEKLCGATAIDAIFAPAAPGPEAPQATLCYPLRMVWRHNPTRHNDADVRFLISVPKRRLRHAVSRVLMRRRIREAYRLTSPRPAFGRDNNPQASRRLDIAFIYVASTPEPYHKVLRAMQRLLQRLPGVPQDPASTPQAALQGPEPQAPQP